MFVREDTAPSATQVHTRHKLCVFSVCVCGGGVRDYLHCTRHARHISNFLSNTHMHINTLTCTQTHTHTHTLIHRNYMSLSSIVQRSWTVVYRKPRVKHWTPNQNSSNFQCTHTHTCTHTCPHTCTCTCKLVHIFKAWSVLLYCMW